MIYIVQAENRQELAPLMESIKLEAYKNDYAYERFEDTLSLGLSIAPKASKYPRFYSKFAVLRQYMEKLNPGDIFIFIDSDIYCKKDGLKELVRYITSSHKRIFLLSYITKVNTGIIGVKVDQNTKEIIKKMPIEVNSEIRQTDFGVAVTSDEELWHSAMDRNFRGINELIDILPTTIYAAVPQKEIFGNEVPWLQADKYSYLTHFTTKRGKEIAEQYIKEKGI